MRFSWRKLHSCISVDGSAPVQILSLSNTKRIIKGLAKKSTAGREARYTLVFLFH